MIEIPKDVFAVSIRTQSCDHYLYLKRGTPKEVFESIMETFPDSLFEPDLSIAGGTPEDRSELFDLFIEAEEDEH